MNLIETKCAFCGKEFFRTKGRFNEARKFGWKQYCSWECLSKDKIKKGVLFCENCGRDIERTLNEVSSHNYCSQSCAAIMNNRKYRKRKAKLRTCPICKKQFGGNRKYCSKQCKLEVLRSYTPQDLIKIIKKVARELKRTPAKREIRKIADMCVHSFGSWNNAIVAAGLEPNRSHNQQMYKCTHAKALDGHICNSVSELIIDNWLTENKIIHDRNVPYPKTNHKADWGINFKGEIVFVEYFGLAKDSPRYDKSVEKKKDICRKYKIPLIEIYPKDLYFKGGVSRKKLKEKFRLIIVRPEGLAPSLSTARVWRLSY